MLTAPRTKRPHSLFIGVYFVLAYVSSRSFFEQSLVSYLPQPQASPTCCYARRRNVLELCLRHPISLPDIHQSQVISRAQPISNLGCDGTCASIATSFSFCSARGTSLSYHTDSLCCITCAVADQQVSNISGPTKFGSDHKTTGHVAHPRSLHQPRVPGGHSLSLAAATDDKR